MKRFYFTFGTDPQFPYTINQYVVVEAEDIHEAIELYKMHHPNRPYSNCVNCAFYYSEAEFLNSCAKYYGSTPIEVIAKDGRLSLNSVYYDTEQGETVTGAELYSAWTDAVRRGEIDITEQPFLWYVHNCLTAFGGTLERL